MSRYTKRKKKKSKKTPLIKTLPKGPFEKKSKKTSVDPLKERVNQLEKLKTIAEKGGNEDAKKGFAKELKKMKKLLEKKEKNN